jgi:glycerol uptake facilitator-like aquaporin
MVMAAILINFSRTICGVLIDASQVVIMTFLNAISATIGGSVINSFYFASFEKFHRSVGADTGNFVANLATPGIVSAAILAFVFSAFVCIMLFLYAGILLMRVIRLWVLIVLSPLAFIFSILPSTQGYAKQWWDELADDLITGPVIIFFMWLALTIVGSGQINQELLNSSDSPRREELKEAFQNESAGVTDVLGWNNLANMMIGIGILMVGIRVSGQIGGTSGSIMSSALTWGKKVATIATGYAAGRWLYEKGVGVAKETPGAIYRATVGKPIARSIDMLKSKVAIAGTLGRFGTVQRNKRAKELEDRGGGWNKFKAWLIESGDRKDKMVKDYQDAAEKAKYIDEENFSTSGLGGGKLKLNLGEVARSHEDVANAKKTEKLQGERNRQNELTEAMAANLENEESVFDDADKKYAAAKKRHEENQTPATRQALRDAERERDRAKAEYDQKRKAYSLEELLAYDTRKVALASTVKGEKISDKVREEERRDLAVEKEKSLSDEEIKKLSAKADTAAARADILEKNVNAKQELEKIKILKDIKKGFNRSKEEERIRAEEEAKIISEGLKISEEKMAAEMEKDLRLGEQRGLAQENARARADVDILRQNVETQKKQLALEQQQQARSIYRSPENRQTLEENAAMTAKINALSENISVDQRLLETNAASVFAQSGGQTLLDDTRRKKGELGVVEAEEKSRESLRMVQASIEALETFKDSWERANRMDMESQIHKTNYDTKMDEIRTEQAHQLQINPGTLRTLEDETRERRSRIDQMNAAGPNWTFWLKKSAASASIRLPANRWP